MKKKIIIFFMFFTLINIYSVEHFLGVTDKLDCGFITGYPTPLDKIDYSIGLNYSIKLSSNISTFDERYIVIINFLLENNFYLGYSYYNVYVITGNYGLNFIHSFYPVFKIGGSKVFFSVSVLGLKLKWIIFSYNKGVTPVYTYIKTDSINSGYSYYYYIENDTFMFSPFLLYGFSEKLGLDIILDKNENIILTPFYFNIDILFSLLPERDYSLAPLKSRYGYLYPMFSIGCGFALLFRINTLSLDQ